MTEHLNRRTALKGIAGAAGLAVAGGAGLWALTGPSVAASVNINGTTVEVDDGHLSFVDLDLEHYFAVWDGFDVPVAAVAFEDILEVASVEGAHTLFDQREAAAPVLLSEISTQGEGGDGWGGPGEYASTFDTGTAPDTTVVNQPDVDGPAEATAGWVHADVFWRLITDDAGDSGHSIEDPAVHGDGGDIGSLDSEIDGETETHLMALRKRVHLYQSEPNGQDGVTTDRAEATVYPMTAGEDGTIAFVEGLPKFEVAVTNELSEQNTEGDGFTSGG